MSSRAEEAILLVEDSPADVLIAREALSEAKLLNKIHVAEDGIEAMDFLFVRRDAIGGARREDGVLLRIVLG